MKVFYIFQSDFYLYESIKAIDKDYHQINYIIAE